MKKILFILIVSLCSLNLSYGQEKPAEESPFGGHVQNIVKNSPFHFIEGTFLMSYERMLKENKTSIMLSAGFRSRENTFSNILKEFGALGEVQYRMYVAKPRDYPMGKRNGFWFKGIYAGPFASYRYIDQIRNDWDWVTQQNRQVHDQIHEGSGGVLMGVQFAVVNKVFMDFYTGGGMRYSGGVDPTDNVFRSVLEPGYTGVIPKVGFLIGVGF